MTQKSLKVAVVVASLAAATEVRAQERGAFEELGQKVKPGQSLVLKDSEGNSVSGKLVSISGSEIVILRQRALRRDQEERFQAGSISRIQRPDTMLEGALIGLGVGLAGAGAIASTNEWNPDYGAPGAFMVYGALLGGVGAGVGMAVDSAFKTTIYDASKTKARVNIAPMVRGGRKGVLATVRF